MEKPFKHLPEHIAFIMDGNGRWAKNRLMPRNYGHKQGAAVVSEIVTECFNLGIKTVSLYAFSSENWNRPKDEIDSIFELLDKYFLENINKLLTEGVRLEIMGDISVLPEKLYKELSDCIEKTKNNDNRVLNIGINYGARPEIIRAVNNIISSGIKQVDEKTFEGFLYTKNLASPDLVVRTSGECRVSNFMLYQMAYSELYFTDTLWPDFHKKELYNALKSYEKRQRRFGGV